MCIRIFRRYGLQRNTTQLFIGANEATWLFLQTIIFKSFTDFCTASQTHLFVALIVVLFVEALHDNNFTHYLSLFIVATLD